MNKKYQITDSGRKELEKELAELKSRRGEIAEKIAEARSFGDLSENAEYDAAREEPLKVRLSIRYPLCYNVDNYGYITRLSKRTITKIRNAARTRR